MRGDPGFLWKQCLILRADIQMSCGKKCAQAAHASLGAYLRAEKTTADKWLKEGQKKVVLKVSGERAMFELKSLAQGADIPAFLVTDAGLTEIPAGTVTALGLGPGKSEDLDRLTGDLGLL